MDLALATLLVNGILSLVGSLPSLYAAIQNMNIPEAAKEELLARIRTAQTSIPDW